MRLRARDYSKVHQSTYTKPVKEDRHREKSNAHCIDCGRETPHEIVAFKGSQTITCAACGHQEVD